MDARWQKGGEIRTPAFRFLDQGRPAALAVQYGVRSEDDLARLVRAGDHRAFEELVDRYRERVYALALDCTGSEEQAGDVLCETFVTAFRAAGAGARGTPRRWFYVHTLRAVLARRAEGRHSSRQRIEP